MFGLGEMTLSFLRRQIGLRTDAADSNGSLHAKINATGYTRIVLSSLLSAVENTDNISYEPAETTTYTLPASIVLANTLTVGSKAILEARLGITLQYIICKNLILDGVIKSTNGAPGGAGGGGRGPGGSGSSGLVVIAKQIIGAGSIEASGRTGGDAAAPDGYNYGEQGENGIFCAGDYNALYGGGGKKGNYSSTAGGAGGSAGSGRLRLFLHTPFWALSRLNSICIGPIPLVYSGSAGGGGGAKDNDTASYYSSGGGGAGSLVAAGGQGGSSTDAALTGSGGGGGGAGGLIIVFARDTISNITLSAIGGNGGAGYGDHGGGGGGGAGGFIAQVCSSTSATINVSGGAGGAGSGTDGGNGAAGGNGSSIVLSW